MTHYHWICGLAIASEIDLPGAAICSGIKAPDVTIRTGPVPERLEVIEASSDDWQMNAAQFLLDVQDIGRFLLRDGREIVFEPADGAEYADAAIFLVGSVFGMLLHQRGWIVLHASAIAVGGKAALFCGAAGMGKSTLAAALSLHGYAVLSDDICAIAFDAAGKPVVRADTRQLKLTGETIDTLGLAARRGPQVRRRMQKFFVEPPRGAATAELPLGAIYGLQNDPLPDGAEIGQPNPAEMLKLVRRNAYRPRIVKRTGQNRRYFEAAAAIAGHAGIFGLAPPRGLSRLPQTILGLERHWRAIGLLPDAE